MARFTDRFRAFRHADEWVSLRAERDDLAERLKASEQSLVALSKAISARDNFIAVVGHEMRNPMAPIVLGIERLSQLIERGNDEQARIQITRLGRAADGFVRRATQLLDITRFAEGKYHLTPEPIDVSALTMECIERLSDVARRAGCPIVHDIAQGVVVRTDRASYEQILENLLSNAFKYGQGQSVDVGLATTDTDISLTIGDKGIGIAPEDQARIFEPFERTLQNASRTGGFGVGLWIVGQLTQALGGRVDVTSSLGKGSQFRIILPSHSEGSPDVGQ
jgi:two-component system OmpR family sensor kinase